MTWWTGFLAWIGPAQDPKKPALWLDLGPSVAIIVYLALDLFGAFAEEEVQLVAAHWNIAIGITCGGLVWFRRRFPISLLAGLVVAEFLRQGLWWWLSSPIQVTAALGLTAMFVVYFAVRWAKLEHFHWLALALLAVLALSFTPDGGRTTGLANAVISILNLGAAVLFAMLRRRYVFQTQERLRIQELETRQVLADEVHDIVGHHLSAIALRAEGARAIAAIDTGAVDEALASIRASATLALDEVRSVVVELSERTSGRHGLVGPELSDLATLCSNDIAGPSIDTTVSTDVGLVPTPVSRAAYRIVQEAITNGRRHAINASRIEVAITKQDDRLIIVARDDGRPAFAQSLAMHRGHGLATMASRADRLGGDFAAGPNPSGGWQVRVSLPLDRRPD